MHSRSALVSACLVGSTLTLAAGQAVAQPAAEESAAPASTAVDRATEGNSPVEEPGKNYYFVGLRYRAIVAPKFMMNMFGADGGRNVVVHGVGPEFSARKDGFEAVLSPWFVSYRMKSTPFKAKNDPPEAWELVESNIKVLYLTGDFLWSQELSPEVAINYGIGAGFGIVFGDLHRVQAYAPNGATGPDDYEPCPAKGAYPWCGDDNEHYGNYTEPSWANGGSKPNIYPWLAFPQIGLRIKPHRNFAARLDLAFSTSGFFFGLGADYGI